MRSTLIPDRIESRPPTVRRLPRRMFPGCASRTKFDRALLKLVRKIRWQRQCDGPADPAVKRPNVYAVAIAVLLTNLGLAPRGRSWTFRHLLPRG